mmetsp:Transcript_8275/g.24861  ORF Transcript_8275/g.24861 Transcript_8275/m.24861 type:complete len:89 (+) Transcript_8275:51-317(+)
MASRNVCFVPARRATRESPVATAVMARRLMGSSAMRVSAGVAPALSMLVAITQRHPELMCCVVFPLLVGGGLFFNGLQMFKNMGNRTA